ncbi:hypothetical protein SAMN05444394_3850 [Algoriphagus halophilus]|uniref:Uncharacterized protein n=1 Tax=Algoriphagus halophilus TaxID=226505 RepID=A0A1N6HND6_9BACT|nr:hypothetical protein SAMN05444394_3850 [Algoriphagus halophilus]
MLAKATYHPKWIFFQSAEYTGFFCQLYFIMPIGTISSNPDTSTPNLIHDLKLQETQDLQVPM